MEESPFKKVRPMPSTKQIKLIKHYAEKAGLDWFEVVAWVREGKCTVTDIVRGILGSKLS